MSKKLEIVMTLPEKDLPSGWELATIGNIVGGEGVFKDGDWVESKDQDPNGDVRLIQLADIGDGEYRDRSSRFLTYKKALDLRCTFIDKGDVLVARMPNPLGRACIFPGDKKTSVTVVDVCIIRPKNDDISKRLLMYFINAPAFRTAVASLESGSTRKRISRKNLARISFPVPPSDEQKRIVAEIEKQFSRLDEAVDNLKRVKANLKRYKASVLKAAVEGKLTEEWRKKHPDVEPADKLLKLILAERRKKWEEAELAKMRAKGKEPKDDKWKKKYKEPAKIVLDDLPILPKEWIWVAWEAVLSFDKSAFKRGPFGSALKKSIFVESGYKVYEQYCPINDDCSFARYFITKEKFKELESFAVQAKDFLISCSGSLGRITQVPDEFEEGIINQALLRVRLNNNAIGNVFFKMLFRSPYFQKQILANATGSAITNVKAVNELKAIPLPLPPLEEQKAIIPIIEEHISVVSVFERQIDANLKRAERLRQSILKKAFGGELVSQDMNDEPAIILLKKTG